MTVEDLAERMDGAEFVKWHEWYLATDQARAEAIEKATKGW